MKKAVSLLLALLLALAMGAPSLAEEVPFEPYAEPIHVTILSTDPVATNSTVAYDSNDPRRVGPNENVWIDAYKEYLNIDVERIIADDDTALNALVNTMMASGELPDAMIVSKELFYTLAENEVLADLTDVFNGFSHPYIDVTYTEDILAAGTIDGQLLGLPMGCNFYGDTRHLWIRQDWLDKVNMSAPTTWDELAAVAQAFVDANLGNDYTIGLGLDGLETGLFEAYALPLDVWLPQEDGKYVYSNTADGMSDALLGIQKLYADGLISPDFATSGTLEEEVVNGHCGMLYGQSWIGVTSVKNNMLSDESAQWIAVHVPTTDGQQHIQWTNGVINSFVAISSECEHPEAVLQLMDLEVYLCYISDMGETYYNYKDDAGNDVSIWNMRPFRGLLYGSEFDVRNANLVLDLLEEGVRDVNEVPAYAQNFFNRTLPGFLDPSDRSALGMVLNFRYGYRDTLASYEAGMLVPGYNGPITETMSVYQASIKEALEAAMLEVIMGADVSVYEKAVQDWYTSGGQTITDEVNAYYGA